jgi:hypothetical protein
MEGVQTIVQQTEILNDTKTTLIETSDHDNNLCGKLNNGETSD